MDFKNKLYNLYLNTKVINELEIRIKWWGALDLHALSTPPAFILDQDQILIIECVPMRGLSEQL